MASCDTCLRRGFGRQAADWQSALQTRATLTHAQLGVNESGAKNMSRNPQLPHFGELFDIEIQEIIIQLLLLFPFGGLERLNLLAQVFKFRLLLIELLDISRVEF